MLMTFYWLVVISWVLETKKYLTRHFVTMDMGRPKYFLGIEVTRQKYSVLLSQRKYALDLLDEAGLLGCKPAITPLETNVNLWFNTVIHLMIQKNIED